MSTDLFEFCEIKGLSKWLEKCLNRKVLDFSLNTLTKPGEHFSSVMQLLDVIVAGKNFTDIEVFHLVCKSFPTNPFLVKLFQPELTFAKEGRFYSDVIPAIKIFEEISSLPKEEKIDAFIPCVGSRISMRSDAINGDADAIIVLQNMGAQNFVNEDKSIGFDTMTTLAVLKELAKFHALCIAMRRKEPKLFNSKVRPPLTPVYLAPDSSAIQVLCDKLRYIDGFDFRLRTYLQQRFEICEKIRKIPTHPDDTPYTTVVHRDLWSNNIMVSKDSNGNPNGVKIYDFQLCFYHSFVCDLIYFLFMSVRIDDLKKGFPFFIHQYYMQFVKTMKSLNFPLNDYSFTKMWKEICEKAKIELFHILFSTQFCLTDGDLNLLKENTDTFPKNQSPPRKVLNRWRFVLNTFIQNGFI